MYGESSMETYITICKIDKPMEICCMTQGTQSGALWQPRRLGWGGRQEVCSRGRAQMYTYGWFMLMFGRNQHNSVKQLSFNLKNKLKIKKKKGQGGMPHYCDWKIIFMLFSNIQMVVTKFDFLWSLSVSIPFVSLEHIILWSNLLFNHFVIITG